MEFFAPNEAGWISWALRVLLAPAGALQDYDWLDFVGMENGFNSTDGIQSAVGGGGDWLGRLLTPDSCTPHCT